MKYLTLLCCLILLGLQNVKAQDLEANSVSEDSQNEFIEMSEMDSMVDIVLFPNPTKGKVTLSSMTTMDTADIVIKILNAEGSVEKVLRNLGDHGSRLNAKIDLSHSKAGTYYYFLYDGDALITKGKIIKE